MKKLLNSIRQIRDKRFLRHLDRALSNVTISCQHADEYLAVGGRIHFTDIRLNVDPEGQRVSAPVARSHHDTITAL